MPPRWPALQRTRVGRSVATLPPSRGWTPRYVVRPATDDRLGQETDAAPTGPALRSLHGRSADRVPAAIRAASIGAPWFARLSSRMSARLRHRRSPDLLDVLIAAGCFAVFSGPVLAGLAAGAGSRPAIAAIQSSWHAAPLIMRRRWPHRHAGRPRRRSTPARLCSASSSRPSLAALARTWPSPSSRSPTDMTAGRRCSHTGWRRSAPGRCSVRVSTCTLASTKTRYRPES